jgi:hypothetical protein
MHCVGSRCGQERAPIASSISINPFTIILGGANAEGEFTLSPDISLGMAGTYFPSSASGFDKGEHYGTFDVKLRFYPQERTPRGFSVAVTGGMVNYRLTDEDVTSGATLGFEADYNWLLGRRQRFLVGTGLGVRRVLGKGDDIVPALRFQLGYTFPALRAAKR